MKYWILLLFASIVWSAGVDVEYILQDGTEGFGRFWVMRSDSIFISKYDSLTPQSKKMVDEQNPTLKGHKFEFRQVRILQTDSLLNMGLSNFVPLDLDSLQQDSLARVQDAKAKKKGGNASLYINSKPDGAQVYLNKKLMPGVVTPAVITGLPAGTHLVQARKYLAKVDYWGTEQVELLPNDTLKVSVTLQRPFTNLKVESTPTHAEVYLDKPVSLNYKSPHITPSLMLDIYPGDKREVRLFKVGYYDTLIVYDILPFETNRITVDLRAIEDPQLIDSQLKFIRKRSLRKAGKYTLWVSIVPMLVSGWFFYDAEQDYKAANLRKQRYERATFESEETARMVVENKEYIDSGDKKVVTGITLVGAGLALSAIGIILYF
jgi:hypothetical protein